MKGKPSNYGNKIKTGSPNQGNNMGIERGPHA